MLSFWYLVLIVIVILVIAIVLTKNRIARAVGEVGFGRGQVDAELQRRHDLIPNFVTTAKMHANHERQMIETIANAYRDAISAPRGTAGQFHAEIRLSRGIEEFRACFLNSPELRMDSAFMALMNELSETEGRIQRSRLYYNNKVRIYLNLVRQMPGCWLHSGESVPEFFVADLEAHVAPVVR